MFDEKIRKFSLHYIKKGGIIIMKLNLIELFSFKGVKNMDILSVEVGGFRNITNVMLEFDSITALVGLNGYGKSNIIDAIDYGFDFIHLPSKVHQNMMSNKKCIPILKCNAGNNYSFDFVAHLKSRNKNYYVSYGFEFAWKTENHPAKVVNEHLNIKLDKKGQQYNSFIIRNGDIARYRSSETGRCSKSIKIDNDSLVLTKLLAIDDLYYSDIINQIDSTQYFIERHLDASSSYVPDPFVIKGFQELELQGIQSIPRAIYYLKKDYQDKYELLKNAFIQLFPEIKDINVREYKLNQENKMNISDDAPFVFTDSIYSMSIIDDRMIQPVNFENLSDGAKRIFLMLTFAIIADVKGLSLIAIEEPENSINPGLLQKYLDVLSQLINNCKIVITSHSPYILQYLDPHSIYVGVCNEMGESSFNRISSKKITKLYRDASEYDKSVGDYIFNILSSAEPLEYLKDYLETNGR